jgi:hypothetical protein
MRFFSHILLIFVLLLQMQGGATMLGVCASHWSACATVEMEASDCACEHSVEGQLHASSSEGEPEGCPSSCQDCHLEAHASDVLIAVQSTLRTAHIIGELSVILPLPIYEGSAEPTQVAVLADPPDRIPSIYWGVWRL